MEHAAARHRLLARQIRRATGPSGETDLGRLLEQVAEAYEEQDESRRLNDRAVELMSLELHALSARIETDAAARTESAEARMAAVLDHASDAVVTVDPNDRILSFNPAARRMFMLAPDAVGQPVSDYIGAWGGFAAEAAAIEATGRRATGETFHVEYTVTRVMKDREGASIAICRDVSARNREAAELRKARDAAEAASRAKSEFLAAMSHEIRTPLNGVLGMAAVLGAGRLDEDQVRMVQVILESGRNLMTLLSDLLDLSKIEAGGLELERMKFDLADSAGAVMALYGEAARERGLDLRLTIEPSAEGLFEGDPTRVRQILQNLVSNAVKFTERGGVSVRVRAFDLEDDDPRVEISVADTGIGIAPAAQARLFRKFSQADASTTRRYGGTGLGLAISHQLATAMGGTIAVESRTGEGACFTLVLPLPRRAAVAPPAPAAGQGWCDMTGLRVLAAEDNRTNQMVLQAILKPFVGEVVFAADGVEAIEAARREAFDLILMDIQMPTMDGMAATREIRAMGGPCAETPIIALSADAMSHQVQACLAAGMDAHVAKPIAPDELLATMQRVLMPPPVPQAVAV